MLRRLAVIAACAALAACAGLEPAGRNASRAPQPTPPRAASPAPTLPPPAARTPPPVVVTPAPTPAPALVVPPQAQRTAPPAPVTAAPPPRAVTVPPPAAAPPSTPTRAPVLTPQPSEDDIIVPGQREQQVLPPNGDPRSTAERMEDIRAWDQCVVRVQSAFDRDPMRPQLDSPEEYCGRSLGMANRNAIPISRQERRR